ncbi:6680_t:CDS:10 [Entrophospora sp. SA101]|nr:6680_t:CDS:10 [Entrophospora sp. SA101]
MDEKMGYLNNFVILEGDSEGDEDSNNNMTAISDIFGPYTSIIKKVCNKCERILEYYDNFQDKNIKFCGILVDFMHFNIKHLTRSKEENLENFKQATFYQSFNRFEIALNSIEKFIYGISDYGIVRNFMILSMLRKSLDNHFNEIWTLCMDFQKNGDIIDTSRLILVKTLQEFRNRNQSPQEPSKNRNSETMKGANLDPNSTAEAAATTAITKTTTINQEIDGMGDAKVANFDKEVQEFVPWMALEKLKAKGIGIIFVLKCLEVLKIGVKDREIQYGLIEIIKKDWQHERKTPDHKNYSIFIPKENITDEPMQRNNIESESDFKRILST